jgi:hypothetical protein
MNIKRTKTVLSLAMADLTRVSIEPARGLPNVPDERRAADGYV